MRSHDIAQSEKLHRLLEWVACGCSYLEYDQQKRGDVIVSWALQGTHDEYYQNGRLSPDGTTLPRPFSDHTIRLWNPVQRKDGNHLNVPH